MASSLSNILNNLFEGIHKIKCKHGHNVKNVKDVELHTKYNSSFLDKQTNK